MKSQDVFPSRGAGRKHLSQSTEFHDVFHLPEVDETCGQNLTKKWKHTYLINFHSTAQNKNILM